MKLALLGHSISHSLSPRLYQEILGSELECYDLLDFQSAAQVPALEELAKKYDGLNITTPYKELFINQVVAEPLVQEIGAINTISFGKTIKATNTDVLAVEDILKNYLRTYGPLHIILLGNGVMARVTKLVSFKLGLSLQQLSRSQGIDMAQLNIADYKKPGFQSIVINSCSRSFVFKGRGDLGAVFWDYNYAFGPHEQSLPSQFLAYQDGQELLRLQAIAAVRFWQQNKY